MSIDQRNYKLIKETGNNVCKKTKSCSDLTFCIVHKKTAIRLTLYTKTKTATTATTTTKKIGTKTYIYETKYIEKLIKKKEKKKKMKFFAISFCIFRF